MTSAFNGYVVIHNSSSGADAWACTTERAAKDSVYCVMLEVIDDLYDESDQKELLNLIKTDQYDEAVELWFDKNAEVFEYTKFSLEHGDDKGIKEHLSTLVKQIQKRLTQGDDDVEVWPADDPS